MLFSIFEIIDIIAMSLIVGYIFSDVFRQQRSIYDYINRRRQIFDWGGIKYAVLLTAPAIILHELGHKFVAMGFGLNAEFHAAYFWLLLGVIMKMFSGTIFFVPAYVSIYGIPTNHFAYSLTAIAGPAVNILLWAICFFILKYNLVDKKNIPLIFLSKKINGFLAIFNLIPIPGFDGFNFLIHLF